MIFLRYLELQTLHRDLLTMHIPLGGIHVTGRVQLPTTETLPEGSCLTVSSRKLIQCRHNNCKIPPVATKTFDNVQNDRGIPYSLRLPVATPGKYIISAVVNRGWCKSEDSTEWIKTGDFFNKKVHDFEIKNDTSVVAKNIETKAYETEVQKTGINFEITKKNHCEGVVHSLRLVNIGEKNEKKEIKLKKFISLSETMLNYESLMVFRF